MKKIKNWMTAFLAVSAVMMSIMFVGCPPTGATPQGTEPQIDEGKSNTAASGISANVTVKGKLTVPVQDMVIDTTCDIALDAANGTFEATGSVDRATVTFTFKGEFFYDSGKLQLNVETVAVGPITENVSCYFYAEIAQTAIIDGAVIQLEESNSEVSRTCVLYARYTGCRQ